MGILNKNKKKVKYFTCSKDEPNRINEGLENRGIDANSVINIEPNNQHLTVWYRES